jgi:protein-S-isoprenylcysteine O-methyltransferase
MDRLALKRHAMPAVTTIAWAATALACAAPAAPGAWPRLAAGLGLLLAGWLVEWRGIAGDFEDRVPRHRLVVVTRATWLLGLVVATADAWRFGWTPWQGPEVRAAGYAIGAAGLALRLWSMRTLAGAFSYDLKVREGQALVRRGPYRLLRHPAYTGMLLWSAGLGLWNPSLVGLLLLMAGTLPQLAYRIGVEERLLEAHFGEAWREHARATSRVIPLFW